MHDEKSMFLIILEHFLLFSTMQTHVFEWSKYIKPVPKPVPTVSRSIRRVIDPTLRNIDTVVKFLYLLELLSTQTACI